MPLPASPSAVHPAPTLFVRARRWFSTSRTGHWLAAVLFVVIPFLIANALTKLLLPDPDLRDLRNLIKLVVLGIAYWAFVRGYERRDVQELSARHALPELLSGLLLGGLLFSGVVAVLAAVGAYAIASVGTLGDLGAVAADMLPKIAAGALVEELVFRLVLLRLLERSIGTVWALLLSSLVFGLAHLGNDGATPLVAIMLGVELGLLFGAAYLLTRRLWLCAALHLSWNFTQGAIFSIAVSGQTGEGWIDGHLSGPAWLTGGAFGAEGSVVAVVVCLAATGILLALAGRFARSRGQV